MFGRKAPCRASAWPHRLLGRQHPFRPVSLPALIVVAALLLLPAGALIAAGCGSDVSDETTTTVPASTTVSTMAEPAEGTFPVTVTDDNQESVTIQTRPMRIVSTAPSNTEILFALGVGDRVVGVTALDDYPPEAADIAKIGDFQTNTEAVMALSPDLVVGYAGAEEALAPVEAAGAPVLILNPTTLEQIYANITTVGAATGAIARAAELVESLKTQIRDITEAVTATGNSPKVFYALDNTLWTAGPGSFVDELLTMVNAVNVGSMPGSDNAAAQAYYQFAPEQLIAADPDIILLPNTAYQSADEFIKDPRFAGLTAVKQGRVLVIDDVIITRPGPRIGEGIRVLAEAIHTGAF